MLLFFHHIPFFSIHNDENMVSPYDISVILDKIANWWRLINHSISKLKIVQYTEFCPRTHEQFEQKHHSDNGNGKKSMQPVTMNEWFFPQSRLHNTLRWSVLWVNVVCYCDCVWSILFLVFLVLQFYLSLLTWQYRWDFQKLVP